MNDMSTDIQDVGVKINKHILICFCMKQEKTINQEFIVLCHCGQVTFTGKEIREFSEYQIIS